MLSLASTPRRAVLRRVGLVVAAAIATAAVTPVLSAVADTAPVPPVTLKTVSADALPTVQINGVAWDQVVVGNRVYVTGQFTAARPAGAAPYTHEKSRSNILAYSLTTGKLITGWAPTLNAEGHAIAASPDGKRIFVAGSFTSVNGSHRYRVAALDAHTGKLIPGWNVVSNTRVRSLAVSGSTLYLGGIFSTIDNRPRTRLAAVSVSTGALRAWAPTADAEVLALAAPAGSGKIVAGGKFTHLNSSAEYGMGALSTSTGAVLPWSVNGVVQDAGDDAAIYSLKTDGKQVYGTGYSFGPGGNFEGSFAAKASSGALVWVNGCRGDTYDSQPVAGVLYTVGHAHDCSSVGANPESSPRTYQRAQAESTARAASGAVDQGGQFDGRPAPEVLHWLPTLDAGTYTGQSQGAWTIEGTSRYVVLGGEFPKVNHKAQQGLVRFAISSIAPNKQGPQGGSEMTPSLSVSGPGHVALVWKSAWDRDNRRLTYEVLRGSPLSSATVLKRTRQDSAWWSRRYQSYTDVSAPGGSQTYRIRVKDAFGNTVVSATAKVTVPAVVTPSASRSGVRGHIRSAWLPAVAWLQRAEETAVTLGDSRRV